MALVVFAWNRGVCRGRGRFCSFFLRAIGEWGDAGAFGGSSRTCEGLGLVGIFRSANHHPLTLPRIR